MKKSFKSFRDLINALHLAETDDSYEMADDTYQDPAQIVGVTSGSIIPLPKPTVPPAKRRRE